MKLYRLIKRDHGIYDAENRLRTVGSGTTSRAFTVKADALKHFNDESRRLRKENRKFSLILDYVETPEMTAALWIQYLETEYIPTQIVEPLRFVSGDPVMGYAE